MEYKLVMNIDLWRVRIAWRGRCDQWRLAFEVEPEYAIVRDHVLRSPVPTPGTIGNGDHPSVYD